MFSGYNIKRRRVSAEETTTHMLMLHEPFILMLEEHWVEDLMTIEANYMGKNGMSTLMYLIRSQRLRDFDFNCKEFTRLYDA